MNVDEFYTQLEKYIQNEEIDMIEPFLLSARETAGDKEDYATYIAIGNEMIGYYRSIQQYEKAFVAAEDVLLLMEELHLENSEHFASVLLNAAAAYQAAGETKQAYKNCQQALQIYRDLLSEDDNRLVGLYKNISVLLEQLNRNEEAVQALQDALAIIRKDENPAMEEAEVLTGLGLLYFKLDKNTEAASVFKLALEIFEKEKSGSERDTYYGTALAGMGEACYRLGDYADSLHAYERAKDEVKKLFGENESYAVLCENCATLRQCMQGDL